MMPAERPLAKDDPRVIAFANYSETDGYRNTEKWARESAHTKGSLWAAFIAGYEAAAEITDLQAQLDKAVKALQEVDDTLAKLSGSLAELDAALLAQEIAVIALERDNIAALVTAKSERNE